MAIILQRRFSELSDQIEKCERINERVKDINELAGVFHYFYYYTSLLRSTVNLNIFDCLELANEENDLELMNTVVNDVKLLEKELKIFASTLLMYIVIICFIC
jgi:hypothetical protein